MNCWGFSISSCKPTGIVVYALSPYTNIATFSCTRTILYTRKQNRRHGTVAAQRARASSFYLNNARYLPFLRLRCTIQYMHGIYDNVKKQVTCGSLREMFITLQLYHTLVFLAILILRCHRMITPFPDYRMGTTQLSWTSTSPKKILVPINSGSSSSIHYCKQVCMNMCLEMRDHQARLEAAFIHRWMSDGLQ